jgi:hypothetical protein
VLDPILGRIAAADVEIVSVRLTQAASALDRRWPC